MDATVVDFAMPVGTSHWIGTNGEHLSGTSWERGTLNMTTLVGQVTGRRQQLGGTPRQLGPRRLLWLVQVKVSGPGPYPILMGLSKGPHTSDPLAALALSVEVRVPLRLVRHVEDPIRAWCETYGQVAVSGPSGQVPLAHGIVPVFTALQIHAGATPAEWQPLEAKPAPVRSEAGHPPGWA